MTGTVLTDMLLLALLIPVGILLVLSVLVLRILVTGGIPSSPCQRAL